LPTLVRDVGGVCVNEGGQQHIHFQQSLARDFNLGSIHNDPIPIDGCFETMLKQINDLGVVLAPEVSAVRLSIA
jgi:hypothetical protein